MQIQVVDPGLSERGSAAGGPAAVGLVGADYGTADADENDKWDGLSLYTYQDNDPAGTWRAIFMASDNGGVSSPEWRTHTPLRMLTANGPHIRHRLVLYLGPEGDPAWDWFSPDPTDKVSATSDFGFLTWTHSLQAARIDGSGSLTASEFWDRLKPDWRAGTPWRLLNVHTNTHGVAVGQGIHIGNDAPEALGAQYDDGDLIKSDTGDDVEVDGISSDLKWSNPNPELVHFWMLAACQAGNSSTSIAAMLNSEKAIPVCAGFEKNLVDAKSRIPAPRKWPLHGQFMKFFYGYCADGYTVESALVAGAADFRHWIIQGPGYYSNPNDKSTVFYGYDSYKVWGTGSDHLLDVN